MAFVAISFLCVGDAFGWIQTLSEKATDPITNLSQLQFENDYSPANYGSSGSSNSLTIKPLIALEKGEHFPFEQLMRFKFQIPSLPNSSSTYENTAWGDTQFFDLFVSEDPSWGRWGVGPMAIFPTATTLEAGQGKWQIGPALGLSFLKFAHWQIGFLAQNPISFAGNSHKSRQNYLLFQPFITFHFSKNWYVVSNGEWTIDWIHRVRKIPINLGVGHTFRIGRHKIDSSLQIEWMAYQNAVKGSGYVPEWTIQFCFNFLLE